MNKRITFDRLTKDFSMFLDERYIGSRASRTQAEIDLDQAAFDALTHGDAATATELDCTGDCESYCPHCNAFCLAVAA